MKRLGVTSVMPGIFLDVEHQRLQD